MDGLATQPGMVRQATGGGGGGGLSLSSVDSHSTGGFGSSYTATGILFGPAAANRRMIVCFACRDEEILSATIGGVPATIHGSQLAKNTTPRMNTAIFSAIVPTGASGDIVVTFGSAAGDWLEMEIYSLLGDSGHVDTQTSNGEFVPSVTMPTTSGGYRLASFASILGGTPTITWTGIDNDGYRETVVQADSFAFADGVADTGGTVSIEETGTSPLRTTLTVSQFGPA